MAESPPLQGGALPESRDMVEERETEAMEFEASVLALTLLSGGEEEGEVHSADELFRDAGAFQCQCSGSRRGWR